MRSIGDEKTFFPRPEPASPLHADDVIGNYRILRELGSGGMGFVYQAQHAHLGTVHALKVIQPSFSADAQFRNRFHQEAKIMSQLRHPNIVACVDAGLEGEMCYLVMDYIEGPRGTSMDMQDLLDERRASGGWFAEDEAVVAAEGICAALAYAHKFCSEDIPAGVVHRDLKPANILLDKETRLYITDFGLARLIGADFEQSVIALSNVGGRTLGEERTMPGASSSKIRVGTFDYMSPEQREGRPADRTSDVYAMGAILYELLTGRKVAGVPRPPSFVRNELNTEWDRILLNRCLCYEPDERYRTAEELLEEIQGMKQGGLGLRRKEPKEVPEPVSPPEQAPAEEGLQEWHYVHHGTRVGPMSLGEMQELIRRGMVERQTGVWNGEGDWRPAETTELNKFSFEEVAPVPRKKEVPALKGKYVDNRVVWAIVVSLAVLSSVELFAGFVLPPLVWWLMNGGLGVLDERRLKAAGHPAPSGVLAALLIPAYLWRRATMLSQPRTYFWSWIIILALYCFAPAGFTLDRVTIAETAVDALNEYVEELGLETTCEDLSLTGETGPSAYAAQARMSNGHTWPLAITVSNDYVHVQPEGTAIGQILKVMNQRVRSDPSLNNLAWSYRAGVMTLQEDERAMAALDAYDKGWNAEQSGDVEGALRIYLDAAKIDDGFPWAFNNAAWLLATSTNLQYRDGPRAVMYALEAVRIGGSKYWGFQNTLAAAHAEAGDVDLAIQHTRAALELAPEESKADLQTYLDALLAITAASR